MAPLNGGRILVIAGSDSSGGAGIVRDVEVATILGARAAVAITAVTAQTDQRVEAVEPMTPALVTAQMRAALAAERIGAIKTGMLCNAGIVASVIDLLNEYPDMPLVVDPVVRSSSGAALLDADGLRLLRDRLLPRAAIVTPNLPELALLVEESEALDESGAIRQADILVARGSRAVLIKGGHATGEAAVDILVRADRAPVRFETARLSGTMRGTGCALATAIAVSLAQGETLDVSVGRAKHTVFDLIGKALRRT